MTQNILRAWRRFLSLFILLLPLMVVAILAWALLVRSSTSAKSAQPQHETAQSQVETADAASSIPSAAGLALPEVMLQVGNRLNLTFFEKLSFEEEAKWASRSKSRRPPTNFYQRTELSGTFPVEENGVVVIPLLGPIPVAGKTVAEFEAAAASAFEERIGRFGFVSVQVQRQPVYVLGPVKKPGPYEFTPGITVLHTLALAGGLDRMMMDFSNILHVTGESERRQKSSQIMAQMLARLAVLSGESEGSTPEPSRQLIEVAGQQEAERLVRVEANLRRLKLEAKQAELSGLDTLAQAAKETRASRLALAEQIEAIIELQQARVSDIGGLAGKGHVSNIVRIDAEVAVRSSKERLQDAMIAVADAENRIKKIYHDRAKLQKEMRLALAQEIADLRSQVVREEGVLTASSTILDVVRPEMMTMDDNSASGITFEVVRATPAGHDTMIVPGTFALNPGDLVQIRTRTGKLGQTLELPVSPPAVR